MVGHYPALNSKAALATSQSISSFLFLLTPQPEVSQAAALDFLQKDTLTGILQSQSKYRMQPQLPNPSSFTYISRCFCFLLI